MLIINLQNNLIYLIDRFKDFCCFLTCWNVKCVIDKNFFFLKTTSVEYVVECIVNIVRMFPQMINHDSPFHLRVTLLL